MSSQVHVPISRMKEPVCLLIGGGAVGAGFHLPRLLHILDAQSVTVVDTDATQRQRLEQRFAGEARIRVRATVPEEAFDLTVIATPPKYHLSWFETLAGRCSRFVIEKPLAAGIQDAQRLLALARESAAKIFVCLPRRSMESFRLMRRLLEEGVLAKPDSVEIAEGSIYAWRAVSLGSFSRELNGGGVLMDTGPHVLDQVFQVFDNVSLRRTGMDVLTRHGTVAIEANVHLELIVGGDIPVRVSLSRNRSLSGTAEFRFGAQRVVLGMSNNRMEFGGLSGARVLGYPDTAPAPTVFGDLFDRFYGQFVATDRNDEVTPELAVRVQELIDHAYETAVPARYGF